MTSYEIGTWIAAFLTLAVFSYLYGENPFYKFSEHLFVGLSAGYGVALQVKDVLRPNLFDPLFATGASVGKPHEFFKLAWLVLAMLMFTKFSRKVRWLGDWPIAFIVGAFAGTSITAYVQGDLVAQIRATMLPLWGASDIPWYALWVPAAPINNVLIVVGLLTSLAYFFFSVPHKGAMKVASRTGIYFLMIGFGASFGYTVMGRLSLTIGRALQLFEPSSFKASKYAPWPATVSGAIIIVGLTVWHRRQKAKTPAP